jgi:hypothetical protein
MSLRSRLLLACLIVPCSASEVIAAPYRPASDTQILERLPFKPNDPVAREMVQLRAELQQNPRDVDAAVRLARRYYNLVAEEGDPRYLGYAQAALVPWWDMPVPPIEVQVLRAGLGQFRHDFAAALDDLSKVIERDPGHAGARSLRADPYCAGALSAGQNRLPGVARRDKRFDCHRLRGNGGRIDRQCSWRLSRFE